MSQHDMDVANQAGAAFRADLNDALKALASVSSGSSAPTTTFPYQLWADTNTGLLKMRNGANNAWIGIGSLDVKNLGHILPGTVVYHAKNTAPTGFLKCNGGAVSRTTYADLFAEISTTFGVGDGSTTFNLPDLRAEFIRGWDDSRGVDAGRVFGTWQVDLFKGHNHQTLSQTYAILSTNQTFVAGGGAAVFQGGDVNQVTGSAGGTETRPRNVALLPCIKF